MAYVIIGLGNPGTEYENTRHNTGRIVLDALRAEYGEEFTFDKKSNALVADGRVGKEKVIFVAPETFMNKSGSAVSAYVKSKKAAEKLVVIYDDFSLPLGRIRISYNRSSGGHNGLESVIKALKTEAFTRIRIGTAPENAKGNAKTLHGEEKVEKFILGAFTVDQIKDLKKVSKRVIEALQILVKDGRDKAMSLYNG